MGEGGSEFRDDGFVGGDVVHGASVVGGDVELAVVEALAGLGFAHEVFVEGEVFLYFVGKTGDFGHDLVAAVEKFVVLVLGTEYGG